MESTENTKNAPRKALQSLCLLQRFKVRRLLFRILPAMGRQSIPMSKEEFMDTNSQTSEIKLYRCSCHHCDAAEEDLTRLSTRYGMKLTIKHVEKEPYMDQYAGWHTPMVYINGHEISHYTLSAKKWEEAMKQAPSTPTNQPGESQ
jgi:glutaredoxin